MFRFFFSVRVDRKKNRNFFLYNKNLKLIPKTKTNTYYYYYFIIMSDTTISIPEIDFDCTNCPGFAPFPALFHLMGKKKENSTKEEEEETSTAAAAIVWKEWYLCPSCFDHFVADDGELKDYNYVSERICTPVPKTLTERGRKCLQLDQMDLQSTYKRCDCAKQLAQCTGCCRPHLVSQSTGLSSCLQLLDCCEMTKHEYGFMCARCVKEHQKDCYREKRKLPDSVDCTSCGKNVKTSDWASRCINKEKDSWLCLDCIGKVKKMRMSPDCIY